MNSCPNCPEKELKDTPAPNNVALYVCPNCQGTWFAEGSLAQLTGNHFEVEKQLKRAIPDAVESDKPSPINGQPMLEIPYKGRFPIYLCQATKGIWVEKSEFRGVLG